MSVSPSLVGTQPMFNMRLNIDIIRVAVVSEDGGTRVGVSEVAPPPDVKLGHHSVQQQGRNRHL